MVMVFQGTSSTNYLVSAMLNPFTVFIAGDQLFEVLGALFDLR